MHGPLLLILSFVEVDKTFARESTVRARELPQIFLKTILVQNELGNFLAKLSNFLDSEEVLLAEIDCTENLACQSAQLET